MYELSPQVSRSLEYASGPIQASFKVTTEPIGPAPDSIKEQWIGMSLPVRRHEWQLRDDYPYAVETVHSVNEAIKRRSGSKIGLQAVRHAFLLDGIMYPFEQGLVRIDGLDALRILEEDKKEALEYWVQRNYGALFFRYEEGILQPVE